MAIQGVSSFEVYTTLVSSTRTLTRNTAAFLYWTSIRILRDYSMARLDVTKNEGLRCYSVKNVSRLIFFVILRRKVKTCLSP